MSIIDQLQNEVEVLQKEMSDTLRTLGVLKEKLEAKKKELDSVNSLDLIGKLGLSNNLTITMEDNGIYVKRNVAGLVPKLDLANLAKICSDKVLQLYDLNIDVLTCSEDIDLVGLVVCYGSVSKIDLGRLTTEYLNVSSVEVSKVVSFPKSRTKKMYYAY